ncbi:MAG: hypothetical protein AB7O96_11735 [Pseudobdellovibrionaceae bacterium]
MAFVLRLMIGMVILSAGFSARAQTRLNLASPLMAMKESILLQKEFFSDEEFFGGTALIDGKSYLVSDFASTSNTTANENSFECPLRDPSHDVWAPTCQWRDRAFADHVRPPLKRFPLSEIFHSFEAAEVFFNKIVKNREIKFQFMIVWQLENSFGYSYEIVSSSGKEMIKFYCEPIENGWRCQK